jgi:pimeloyl-ACP methyl ester carboxylesterase
MGLLLSRLFRLSACVLAAYGALCAAMWGYQAHLVFSPDKTLRASPADFPFPVAEAAVPLTSTSRAHQTIHGWWIPARDADAKVVLYLHGNDGNVSTSISEIALLRGLGCAILLIDYRGFGKSAGGFPSEASTYEDAEAAWDYLVRARGVPAGRLFIYGHSLGGAVAIELALRHPEAAGLIVESSFTSIYDLARLRKQYALLPIKLFLNQKFESQRKAPQLSLPGLYIHGTADDVVPFGMGRRLFESAGGAKRFVAVEGAGHDNNAAMGGSALRAALAEFLDQNALPSRAAGTQPGLNSSSM